MHVKRLVAWGLLPGVLALAPRIAGAQVQYPTTEIRRQGVGDGGGHKVNVVYCQSNQALTSVTEIIDNGTLTEINFMCQPVDETGHWVGKPYYSPVGFMRENPYPFSDHAFDGKVFSGSCAKDSTIVGFNAGVEHLTKDGPPRDIAWVQLLQCRDVNGTVTAVNFPFPPGGAGHRLIGFDGMGNPRSCTALEWSSGVWAAVSAKYIESFGLTCTPMHRTVSLPVGDTARRPPDDGSGAGGASVAHHPYPPQ